MTHIIWTTRLIFLTVALWIMTTMFFLYIEFEGHIMPVVHPLEIIELNEQGDGWTQIVGRIEKVRNCLPISIRWYQGELSIADRLNRIPIPVRIGEQNDITRGLQQSEVGNIEFSTIYVRLDADTIRSNSYAHIYHYCHNRRLWETQSLFYISNEDPDS